jgi:hypothetical protein
VSGENFTFWVEPLAGVLLAFFGVLRVGFFELGFVVGISTSSSLGSLTSGLKDVSFEVLLAGVFLLFVAVLWGVFVDLGFGVSVGFPLAADCLAPLAGVLRGARREVDFAPGVARVSLVPFAGV